VGKVVSKVAKGAFAIGFIALGVATGGVTFLPGTALAFSIGAGTFLATGLALGASLLAPSPKAPKNSGQNVDRLRASLDPRTPRKTVVGVTAMATDIRDEEFTDSQDYFHRFIVVASHKVNAITEIWFDDKLAWTSAGGVQGEFAGYLTVATRLEGSAANAINISARMGSTRRYTGLAYVHLRYKLTGNSKKTESPFAQSITTRITIRGEGAALYDPRLDSTVPGGSGSHRADDQSTWIWDEDSARNPALQLLFYLLGYRINGILAVGKGIPPSRIDLESFAVAANLCDETVAKFGGGTEPRYRSDGVWSEGDSPSTVMDMLKATMNADLDDVGGKLRLTVFHNDLATPVADFTDNDVLDEFEWQASPSLDQTFNVVRGVFTDPSNESLYQQIDYPQQEVASPDGIERAFVFDLPMVQSAGQAQRLAALKLARMVHGAGTFTADFQATAWAAQKNSVVRLSFGPRGFTSKLFRVGEMEIRQDGTVPMVLREEGAAIYGLPSLAAPVAAVATTPYDRTLNPIFQTLTTAENALIATSYVTDADPSDGLLQATDTQIVIEDHTRTYTDKTVSVTGGVLTVEVDGTTAISAGKTYHIYYDDPARTGGAVALKAGLSAQEAATSSTNPSRHYVGTITSDVVGGGGTSGGGATPPGWQPGDYYEP
jgi:hypothetical protein